MEKHGYREITDVFYANILEFIMLDKALFEKMMAYEKLFQYPGQQGIESKKMCLDWFIFDYKEPESNVSVLEIFMEKTNPEPALKMIYTGFKNFIYGLFEVKAVRMGKQVLLSDVFSGVEHSVTDTTFTRNIQKGDVCILRILPFEDIKIIAGDAYKLPREAAVYLKINKEVFRKAKGGLSPLDMIKMFHNSDPSSSMKPKERLIYLCGRAGLDEGEFAPLMGKLEREAEAKGNPSPILAEFAGLAGMADKGRAARLGQAAVDYWNSLQDNEGHVAKGPVETAVMNLAFSIAGEGMKPGVTRENEIQVKMDKWFKQPLAVLDNKTPEEAIIEERKSLNNPELRLQYRFNMQEIKPPAAEKDEAEAERLFDEGIELQNNGNYRGALSAYEKYCDIWDGNHVVNYNMGVCHFFLKEYKKSENRLKKAIQINPGYEKAIDALNDLKERKLI